MNNNTQKILRAKRVRAKITGTEAIPRLSVFRSNVAISAQLIDDIHAKTLVGITEKQMKDIKGTKKEKARTLGMHLAKIAKEKKIDKAVFDRGRYRYHGRIKAFAEGAREGGLRI